MNVLDLRMTQAVCFSVHQALQGVDLVHHYEVCILVTIIDGTDVGPQKLVVKLVVASHFQFEVLDGAAELEEVLDDVFRLASVFTRL